MKTSLALFMPFLITAGLLPSVAKANSAPVVSNITVSQRTDGSKKVDIRYNLSDADGERCTVSVQVSGDGGSTWTVPAVSFSGAVGAGIAPGTGKLIVWDCAADLPGVFGTNYWIKVTADDNYYPSGMVWVSINDAGFNGQMSKYETTNDQYWQFLNAAKASNLITVYNNAVYATSDPSHSWPYYNLAGSGNTYNGATNGGAARINYTGISFTVDSGFEKHPVTYVSWYGSTAFCNYYGYRLPTEWEWQAVADYKGSYTYGCGTSINNSIANYYNSSHPNGTTVVGSVGNPSGYGYGMCDMAGNVWEWTSSIYSGSDRVLRGGSWYTLGGDCAVLYRGYGPPSGASFLGDGFRVCRGTAGAGTGSATWGRFTIDNRSGSGFRVTSLEPDYAGVFPDGVNLINTFTATVDWAGKTPSKVVFTLNGVERDVPTSSPDAKTTFNMGQDLEYSSSGCKNELTAYAVASDGERSQAGILTLWGLALPEWAILDGIPIKYELDLLTKKLVFSGEVKVLKDGVKGTVEIPKSIPKVGGKWGVEIDPLDFTWKMAAQPSYGTGSGLTGTFGVTGNWGASVHRGESGPVGISAGLDGAGQFYPEFKLTDVSAYLELEPITLEFPRLFLLCAWADCCWDPCPWFQASITPSFGAKIALEEGQPDLFAGLKFKEGELRLECLVKGTVGMNEKGKTFYAEGAIGGKPYIMLQFPANETEYCLNKYVKEIGFTLSAEVAAKIAWWKREWDWQFEIYRCPKTAEYTLLAYPKGDGGGRIALIDRGYLGASEGYCVFPAPEGGIRTMSVGGLPELILNVGTVAAPSEAAGADDGLLLFVCDDASKPTGKHQEIYYARWTGSEWTTHAPLTDNTRPDLYPAAAIAPDGSEIAVWVTAPEPNGSETGPRDILPGFEIAFSKYDSGSGLWTAPEAITDNDFVDTLPWIETLPSGDIRACWAASPTNAIPVWHDEEIAPLMNVMAADWAGTGFGAQYVVASDLRTSSVPAVCRTDTHEFLVYIDDTDNNAATTNDGQVTVRLCKIGQPWQPEHQLTTQRSSYMGAEVKTDSAGVPVVIWVNQMVAVDGNDTYVDQLWFSVWDGSSWSEPNLAFDAPAITEPELIRNEAGRLILFWVAASKEFSDIYYSAYDSASMQWGQPQQITHDQGAETMLSLAESGGNILAGYVKRRIDLSDANGLPKIGLSDIYLLEHIPAKDLFIGPNDISVSIAPNLEGLAGFCSYWLDEGCGEPNGWCLQADLDHSGTVDFNDYSLFVRDNGLIAEICADIHLSGDFIVEDVNVSFYDGDPNSDTLIGSEIIDTILPGQAKQAKVQWYVPGDKQTHHIYVVVDPNNEIPETDDIGNNKAYMTLFKPDLKAESIAVLGYPGANMVLVGFSVKNSSQTVANPFLCQVRKDSETGEIVHTAQIGSLAPGASAQSQFAWDVSGEDANNYTLVVVADANDQIDESDEGNNAVSGQVPVLPDLEAMQWSGRIEGGMAYITIRNVGAKASQSTIVRVTSEGSILGEQAVGALNPGDSIDVSFSISEPTPGGRVEITVNPDSDGADEVSLLNNTAIVLS